MEVEGGDMVPVRRMGGVISISFVLLNEFLKFRVRCGT